MMMTGSGAAVLAGAFIAGAVCGMLAAAVRRRGGGEPAAALLRAELYAEFFRAADGIWARAGDGGGGGTVRALRELCANALYELSPCAGTAFLRSVRRLYDTCHGAMSSAAPDGEKFRAAFLGEYAKLPGIARKDCGCGLSAVKGPVPAAGAARI